MTRPDATSIARYSWLRTARIVANLAGTRSKIVDCIPAIESSGVGVIGGNTFRNWN